MRRCVRLAWRNAKQVEAARKFAAREKMVDLPNSKLDVSSQSLLISSSSNKFLAQRDALAYQSPCRALVLFVPPKHSLPNHSRSCMT